MRDVIVHEEYKTENKRDDIALLKLSKHLFHTLFLFSFLGERLDLFLYPPVCLPYLGQDFEGQDASVYGEKHNTINAKPKAEKKSIKVLDKLSGKYHIMTHS